MQNKFKNICKVSISLIIALISGSCRMAHPMPSYDEVRFINSPYSRNNIVQIVTTRWTDGIYRESPQIRFKDSDNNTWIVVCYGEDPNYCKVYLLPADKFNEITDKTLNRLDYPYQKVLVVPMENKMVECKKSINLSFDEINKRCLENDANH